MVVLTESLFSEAIALNEVCRSAGIRFISAQTAGLFGRVFCDFGPEFTVVDVNGENPLVSMVVSVSKVSRCQRTCLATHSAPNGALSALRQWPRPD